MIEESPAIQVADAVSRTLNAMDGLIAKAERKLLPLFEPEELDKPHITVVPREIASEIDARGIERRDITIHVGVQKRLDPDDQDADALALMRQVEQINAYMYRRELHSLDSATWLSSQVTPLYSLEHLRDWQVFTSVVQIVYGVLVV